MTDVVENEIVEKSELELLKEQADVMGIEYAKNITVATLKKKIAERLNSTEPETETVVDDANAKLIALEQDNFKLVKVIITPMNPTERVLTHKAFSVGNAVLGTVSRVVPFGKEWLIENILLKHIREKEFQFMTEVEDHKNPNIKTVESKLIPAYAIQELPLPTPKEIEALAKAQQARGSVDN